MGLDYVIQYKKGKENVAADALYRYFEGGESTAITSAIPDCYQKLTASYEGDEWTKELLEQLVIDPSSRQGFTLTNGLLRY